VLSTPAVQAVGERQFLIVALWLIATVAILFFLRTARELLVPIALAVLASYALEPVVAWLERHLIPRAVGAPAVLLLVLALTAGLSYSLIDDAVDVIESLPSAARHARQLVMTRSAGAVQQAAAELGSDSTSSRHRQSHLTAPLS